jgi:hypothetical protein
LAIRLHGLPHLHLEQVQYDIVRTRYLESQGIRWSHKGMISAFGIGGRVGRSLYQDQVDNDIAGVLRAIEVD